VVEAARVLKAAASVMSVRLNSNTLSESVIAWAMCENLIVANSVPCFCSGRTI
jgi:hypothetical protein